MEGRVDPVALWIGSELAVSVLDEASVSEVRERVREAGAASGLPAVVTGALVSAASELAHNHLAHAAGGVVAVRAIGAGDDRGLEVIAADRGPGIADIAGALSGRPSRTGSLGSGLSAVLELADEVDVDARLGEGLCVRARKFARPPPRRRRVGVYGRPCEGEIVSGDDAAVVRDGDALTVAVIDGLGHGPEAREASRRARELVLRAGDVAPDALLRRCDAELRGTRGAVMTAARVREPGGELDLAAVGNVGIHVYGPRGQRRFGGSSFILGSPGGARRVFVEHGDLDRWDMIVIFSDGVSSRIDLSDEPGLIREHPVIVAARAVERFGRTSDDVLVLAVG